MKTMFRPIVSVAAASAMIVGIMSVKVSAYQDYNLEIYYNQHNNFDMEWDIRTTDSRDDVICIDKEQLKKGDYVFSASIYIRSDQMLPSYLNDVNASWDVYNSNFETTPMIRCRNLRTGSDLNPLYDDTVNGTDEVQFRYYPCCFSTLFGHRGQMSVKTSMISFDKTFVISPGYTAVYSDGPYRIKFEDPETGEMLTYDLEYDEKTGTAKTTERLYKKNTLWTINKYDPDIPEGEIIPEECNKTYQYNKEFYNNLTWFGGKSDAYPLVSFDVSVDAEIEEGVYYVGFNTEKSNDLEFINENCIDFESKIKKCGDHLHPKTYPENLMLLDEDGNKLNNMENWLKIVVGNTEKAPSDEEKCDIDGNGRVDISDASAVLKYYAENAAGILKSGEETNFDVNGDGVVNIEDATYILKYYAESAAGIR